MNVLPFTMMVVMLMTVATLTQLHQVVDRSIGHHALHEHLKGSLLADNEYQKGIYEISVVTNLKPGPPPGYTRPVSEELKKPRSRNAQSEGKEPKESSVRTLPRYPYKLSLASLLSSQQGPHADTYREVALALMERLYGPEVPAKEILKRLEEKVALADENKPLEFQGMPAMAEHLASLSLDDPYLQKAWFRMLKGEGRAAPSLLDFIGVEEGEEAAKIHLMFAPQALLQAMFGETEIVSAIVTKRGQIRREFLAAGDGLSNQDALKQKKDAFKESVDQVLESYPLLQEKFKDMLDYDLDYTPTSLDVDGQGGHQVIDSELEAKSGLLFPVRKRRCA